MPTNMQDIRVPGSLVPVLRAEISDKLANPIEPARGNVERESDERYRAAWRAMLATLTDDGTSRDRTLTLGIGQYGTEALRSIVMEPVRERLTDAIYRGPDRSWAVRALAGWASVADQLDAVSSPC